MGKKASGKTYVSKGERPNVSRKLVNAMRREKRSSFDLERELARLKHRNDIMSRAGLKAQKEKIIERERIENLAGQLYEAYERAGATWASAVQAVKTDWVSEYHQKWAPRLAKFKEKQS